MISKILIAVSVILILAGLLGIKAKTIGRKMIFLCISSVGMILLSFAEMNAYGLVGGAFQLVYRLVVMAAFLMVFISVCKKNGFKGMEDLNGSGRQIPYIFAMLVILSTGAIGIPITGTFTGIVYSEIGLLAGGYGVFTYIGLLGNILGIVVPAVLLFPLLRRMYFPLGEIPEKQVVKPGKGLTVFGMGIAALFVVFSVYQKPVMTVAGALMEKIFG